MTRVKICGITNLNDARLAIESGAHALGFVFAPSPRRISPDDALKIIRSIPPFVERVGVFVNEERENVLQIAATCKLTCLQFHGDESARYCHSFPSKVIKAFPLASALPPELDSYRVDAILVDASCREQRGGTGKLCNWHLATALRDRGLPIILSGGLDPDNIEEAIKTVKPYAVDLSSGLEQSPGVKSPRKMAAFFEAIRRTYDFI